MPTKHHIKSSLPDNIHDIQITMSEEKGVVSSVMALFITLGVIVALSIYYMQAYLYAPAIVPTNSPVACAQDVKQCPDGSYVSRIGLNCEFAKCSGENTDEAGYRSQEDCEQKTGQKCGYAMCDVGPCGNFNQGWLPLNKVNEKAVISTSDWKTYRNEQYGFEVKYPSGAALKEYAQNAQIPYFSVCFQENNDKSVACSEPHMMIDVHHVTAKDDILKYASSVYTDKQHIVIGGRQSLIFRSPKELVPHEYAVIFNEDNIIVISSATRSFSSSEKNDFDALLSTVTFVK